MGWYVVETELKRETVAQDCIHELGLETFLPQMRRIKRSHHRFANPYLTIFPRYLFVQFDLAADKFVWPAIRRQRGVRSILGRNLGSEGELLPTAVRPEDFQRLQELAADMMQEPLPTNGRPKPLPKETVVHILWGIMAGKCGKIEFDNGIRADVLLSAAGLVSKITLPRELIEVVR